MGCNISNSAALHKRVFQTLLSLIAFKILVLVHLIQMYIYAIIINELLFMYIDKCMRRYYTNKY